MLTTQGRCPFAAGGQIIHQHPLGRDPPPHPSLFWQDAAPRLDTTFTPGRHELAGGGGGAPLGVCRRFATGEPPPLFPIFLLLSSSTVGTNIGTTLGYWHAVQAAWVFSSPELRRQWGTTCNSSSCAYACSSEGAWSVLPVYSSTSLVRASRLQLQIWPWHAPPLQHTSPRTVSHGFF